MSYLVPSTLNDNITKSNNKVLRRRILPSAVAIALSSLWVGGAVASGSNQVSFALEEVVVVAQKREESLQDVGLTVSAITEDSLASAGVESLDDVTSLVPSLSVVSTVSPALTSIRIRGAGTGSTDATLEPSVGVFIDGVFMPRSVFGLSDLVDVAQVEVLMGPQGTLYGKNTNSGVLSVTTKSVSEELELFVEQSIGNYDLTSTKASVSGPITDEIGYRVAAKYRKRDGIFEEENGSGEYNQIDKQTYQGLLEWSPEDDLAIKLKGYYSASDSRVGVSEVVIDPNSNLGQLTQALSGGLIENTDDNDFKASHSNPQVSDFEVKGGSIHLIKDYDAFTLTSITGYQQWEMETGQDIDLTSLDLINATDRYDEESFSQEIRLTSPGGEAVDWVAGLFYFKSSLARGDADEIYASAGTALDAAFPFADSLVNGLCGADPVCNGLGGTYLLATPGSNMYWESNFDSESIALFGQATFNLTEATSITAGLRYGAEEKDFSYMTSVDNGPNAAALPPGQAALLFNTITLDAEGSDDLREEGLSGMLSLRHYIGDAMLYASLATGEKSGGFNGDFGRTPIEDRGFDTEKTISYEVGLKMDGLLDGRARLNLAYFYTEYEDFQATTFDTSTVSVLVQNAGRQVTQGVDIEGVLALTESLTLSTSVEYLNAIYRDYEAGGCNAEASAPQNVSPLGTCDLTGQRMPNAPTWSGRVSLDYVAPTSGDGEFYAGGTLSFKTKMQIDPTYAPYGEQEGYEMLDLRLGWRSEHWDVSAWGKNVTNENISTYTIGVLLDQALGGGEQGYSRWVNDPATYGVTVRYSY